MTKPTFHTFQTLIAGWSFAPRRTILGMVRASGEDRHHAAFHLETARIAYDKVLPKWNYAALVSLQHLFFSRSSSFTTK